MSTSPLPSDQPTALAPHHLRIFALIIDFLIIVTLLKLGDQLTLGAHWDLRPVTQDPTGLTPRWIMGFLLMLLAKDSLGGRSPGKWLTNIAVRRADDPARAPGPAAGLLRNLTLPIFPVEGYLVFRDPYFRRLGDRWAGTVVVGLPNPSSLFRRWLLVSILFFGMLLGSFLIFPWNMRRSAAYQEAYRIASSHPAVKAAVGAHPVIDTSPEFGLAPDRARATVTFDADGPKGTAKAVVVLRLDRGTGKWMLEKVQVQAERPEPIESQAPPPPKPSRPRRVQ